MGVDGVRGVRGRGECGCVCGGGRGECGCVCGGGMGVSVGVRGCV